MSRTRTHPRLLLLAPLLVAISPLLFGFDYGTPILISSEAEILELAALGEIEEEARDQLLDLLRDPVELNSADRERLQMLPDVTYELADRILERRAERPFQRPGQLRDLVGSAAFAQCRPFVLVDSPTDAAVSVRGRVSARAHDRLRDDRFPVLQLKGRVGVHKWLDAGVLVAEQEDLVGVEYLDQGLRVRERAPKVSLERIHAAATHGRIGVIAGHYAVGFGQRLTFDVTDRERPHGFVADLGLTEDNTKHDSYSVPKRLLGVAGRFDIPLPRGRELELTLFGSIAPQDVYQDDVSLGADDYEVTGGGSLSHVTFPHPYREELAGLNATLRFTSRSHLGLTAWGGRTVRRIDFDFTGIPIPNRPFYGAVGADLALQLGPMDIRGEVAVTDSGGLGTRWEWLLAPPAAEVSLAMRYYGPGFDNPHSRGRSQADQMSSYEDEGGLVPGSKRDKDEVGPQLRAVWQPLGWLRLRATGDLWHRPSLDVTHALVGGRVDVDPLPWLGLDLQGGITDKDLTVGGRDQEYDNDGDDLGRGQRVYLGLGTRMYAAERLRFQLAFRTAWEDSEDRVDAYATTIYGWLKVMWDLTDWAFVALRVKAYDGPPDDLSMSRSVGGYAQLRFLIGGRVTLGARYEVVRDLDDLVGPEEMNPEHLLRAELAIRI